jgi:tRNA pseudouridine55 synthase
MGFEKQAWAQKIKIGHAGTLDPLASGLLLVCTVNSPNAFRIARQVKEYTGTFYVGATTPSYDLETAINETFPTSHLNEALVLETSQQFLGEIDQKPPIFPQSKRRKRLYEHARAGEEVEISAENHHTRIPNHAHRFTRSRF